jgi:serine/threonine protein kinase
MDNALNRRKVVILRQIAEGGFSIVYSAKECKNASSLRGGGDKQKHGRKSFALKQIICHDSDVTSKCREEAGIHRTFHHPNLMPILGCKFDRYGHYGEFRGTICYILFPLCESSLRDQITKRNLLSPTASSEVHPWSEREIVEVS